MTVETTARIARQEFQNVDATGDRIRDRLGVSPFPAGGRFEQPLEGVGHGTYATKFNSLTDIR